MKMAILCFLLATTLWLRTDAAVSYSSSGETLRNVLLTHTGSLIVGSNATLRRLDPLDLRVLQTVTLLDGQVNRVLCDDDPGGTFSSTFIACNRMLCELRDHGDITSVQQIRRTVLLDGSSNALGLFVTGPDGDSVFTTAQRNEVQTSTIRRGNIVEVDGGQEFRIFARHDEASSTTPREFLSAFQHGGFSYYVNRLIPSPKLRVVRLCNNDTGRDGTLFRSYFEVQLACGGPATEPTAATYISDANGTATSIVVSATSSSQSDTNSNTENHLCVYSLSEINTNMTIKYNQCVMGEGLAGLRREEIKTCPGLTQEQQNNPNVNECRLAAELLPAQEVEVVGLAVSVFSQPLSGSQFSSLLHRTVDDVQFIFAGTDNGQLYQYYVNGNSLSLIHTFDLVTVTEVGMANITQLTATSDGLTLYALTPSKLISHSVDVCDSYKSCDLCLGDGRDPICGWCALENRCTRQANCNAESAVWVSDSVGSCPVILSGDPSIIYQQELNLDITIVLITSNIPDGGREYHCSYNFLSNASAQQSSSATNVATTRSLSNAERTESNFTCPLPSDIPDIPNMADALLSNLSLYYNGNDVAVLAPAIRFSDCSTHTTCTSCIRSESQCSWCPFTFKCIASRVESCEGQKERAVNTSCPKLRPPDTIFNNYLIHTNYMYGENPLIIMAENLDTFSDHFQSNEFDCVIRQGELVLFRAPATLGGGGTQVTCQRRQFDHIFEDGEALVNMTLEVVWTRNNLTIDNPSQAGVTLYSCSRLGTNCAVCVSLEADYNCRSCDLSCVLGEDSQCTTADNIIDDVTDCPLATISSVSPASGPLEGGTMVTVAGDNLGTARSDIIEVMIGEMSCDIIDQSYQRGVSFTCVTGSVLEQGQHQISINFTYLDNLVLSRTPNLFTFENPSLSSVTPLVGPQSGGTMVTITGNNLDIGSDLSITLADVECYVDITNDDEVTCCSNSSGELDEGVVRVTIDNWEGVLNEMYRYVADPTVESITPDLAFAAGGTEFIIKGTNLEIIQEPRLLVHISTSQRRRRRRSVVIIESEPCSANRLGTLMTCLAPPTNISSPQQPVTIGLAMDGVTALRRIKDAIIHADPTFRPLGDQSFSTGQEIRLTIESEGSEFIFTEEMVRVLVTPCSEEQCVCNRITFLEGNTSFTCVVGSTAGLDRGRQLSVTVHIGNYNQTVGHIELSNPVNIVLIVVLVVGALVVVALFLVALAAFVFVCLGLYRNKKTGQVELERIELPNTEALGAVPEAMEQAQRELKALLPQKFHIPSSQLRLLDSVGHGEFGEVYKAHLIRRTGDREPCTVAVKTLRGLFTANDVQQILQEVVKMQDFSHPHVMSLIGVCLDAGVGVVMPFMANGSVLNYLKKERETLLLSEEAEIEQIVPARKLLMRLCLQIARGMEYLAQQMFVHRDLAARNCMLDHKGGVKVGDFGLAEDMYATGYVRESSKAVKVPYKWMPPESLEDGVFSELSDVWSFGVTCWEVFTVGKTPYPALDPPTLLRMLREGHRLEYPDNLTCSPEMYAVMKKCWRLAPSDRPTFSELAATLDKTLMSVAGYTELGMTLVEGGGEEEEWGAGYEPVDPPNEAGLEIGMEPNPGYGMGTVVQESHIPTQPNPVYGMGTAGQEKQILSLPNPGTGYGDGPMDTHSS